MNYQEFLQSKIDVAEETGFDISIDELNPNLLPHQKMMVQWAIKGGKRAVFAQFGLGKSCIQLEFIHQITSRLGGKGLICMPLGVKSEMEHDAVEILGYEKPEYVTCMEGARAAKGNILLTNYERLRDNPWDLTYFTATSLDEASVLRSFGSKTYQEFLPKFQGVKYKMVATATPAPNRLKELIHYSGYLEIADTGACLTRYFKRDSTKANNLTLYPSMAEQFWLWVSTWGLFVTKPSDLNQDFSDEGYALPNMTMNFEELPVEYGKAVEDNGQIKLFEDAALGLKQAAHVKRNSTEDRLNKVMELLHGYIRSDEDQAVVWVSLNYEQDTLEKMMKNAGITFSSLTGSQDIDLREELMRKWKAKETQVLLTKPEMYAQGVNLQQCNRMIFAGISYKFEEFIQGVHRIQRFGQERHVYVDAIHMESEREIKNALVKKWKQHEEMVSKMTEIIKKYGLNTTDKVEKLKRKMGCKVREVEGERYKAVNADCIEYTKEMNAESVDMILTSIPFGNHYEYCNNVNDLGYNDNLDRFFEQMDYLTPELLRVLKPGRVCVIHVKDRVLFGNVTGYSFPTMDAFHMYTALHFMKHGFKYFGMITVTTDVVRENNQTYRLGYTKMRKDSTNMGVGCEEYLLLFRKLPTDTSDGFADVRVTHEEADYPLSEWQLNASAFWRDSGDRLLLPEELASMSMSTRMKVWKEHSRSHLYNYEFHKKFSEELEKAGGISKEFMTLPPASISDSVWDDIVRMRTLNLNQSNKKRELHVCPLQTDLVERCIKQYSNKGETVFDPFAGIFTVPYMAVKMGRYGMGTELNENYWKDGVSYCQDAESEVSSPTLFDFLDD